MSFIKTKKHILIIAILILIISSFLNIFSFNLDLPDFTNASFEDINYAIQNRSFGKNYSLSIDKNFVSAESNKGVIKLDVKLFNIIKVNSIYVKTAPEYIYAGGNAVGLYLNTKGAVLMGSNSIITEDGLVDTLKDSELQVGDLLIEINGVEIYRMEDITNILNAEDYNGEPLKIKYIRKDKEYETMLSPALDIQSKKYKLGIWVKNDTSGVGTLTYVKEDLRFGSLGHKITDTNNKNSYAIQDGEIYTANIIGVQKGTKGRPGELKGLFLQGKNSQGKIDKNLSTGVYGYLDKNSSLLESAKTRKYILGGRLTARPGKAKILSTINGTEVKEYDIEIIKANYQNTSREKSMVIKITDSELLKQTGGIVQGMSGSPIIQNGKIIGAVTHVFVNDSTKGYGIYLDWMVEN